MVKSTAEDLGMLEAAKELAKADLSTMLEHAKLGDPRRVSALVFASPHAPPTQHKSDLDCPAYQVRWIYAAAHSRGLPEGSAVQARPLQACEQPGSSAHRCCATPDNWLGAPTSEWESAAPSLRCTCRRRPSPWAF
jgi:hypothetical protein